MVKLINKRYKLSSKYCKQLKQVIRESNEKDVIEDVVDSATDAIELATKILDPIEQEEIPEITSTVISFILRFVSILVENSKLNKKRKDAIIDAIYSIMFVIQNITTLFSESGVNTLFCKYSALSTADENARERIEIVVSFIGILSLMASINPTTGLFEAMLFAITAFMLFLTGLHYIASRGKCLVETFKKNLLYLYLTLPDYVSVIVFLKQKGIERLIIEKTRKKIVKKEKIYHKKNKKKTKNKKSKVYHKRRRK